MKSKLLALISCLAIFLNCFSQIDTAILDRTFSQDSALNALALYPQNVRTQILEVSGHPNALIRMEAIQKNSRDEFKKLLLDYDQAEQQKIWDITRYPGLVDSLVEGGKKSKGQ